MPVKKGVSARGVELMQGVHRDGMEGRHGGKARAWLYRKNRGRGPKGHMCINVSMKRGINK